MDRSSSQKISKETSALNDTLDQMNLIDIYRATILKIRLDSALISMETSLMKKKKRQLKDVLANSRQNPLLQNISLTT